ncbi:TetR/AcrR family transcriptional regulator [Lachnospiraceae bacterium]|nr:TetR/AcrR family transcriptional regulator [Lachnospiraceae bacterium]
MPKQRITKEMVVHAAFEIVRSSGIERLMVKNIAEKIGCSVQPIYSYFENMEELRKDVTEKIRTFIREYISSQIDNNDIFASTGKAYINLAKEEPHLFKVFILHQRNSIASLDDLYQSETNPQMAQLIAAKLNVGLSEAKKLHLNMMIYTIGIGTIFSVTTPGISTEEIYEQLETAYQAFLSQAKK